ncbi:hypothetical protein DPMN_066929 [Dreissena polymorpha]|uniref:Uncharacterized protein n=1 Tax=Dreissena polymorpha TaxID=45954 RepID=A0A9D4BKY7_DREPO|nr:hypothetical protein DPMN_066929 [Dreissena polymorpha]
MQVARPQEEMSGFSLLVKTKAGVSRVTERTKAGFQGRGLKTGSGVRRRKEMPGQNLHGKYARCQVQVPGQSPSVSLNTKED